MASLGGVHELQQAVMIGWRSTWGEREMCAALGHKQRNMGPMNGQRPTKHSCQLTESRGFLIWKTDKKR